jgi:hypothetical protein
MSKQIKLLKNNEEKDLTDIEWVTNFYEFLKEKRLSEKKAFDIIYYLQEHLCIIPDHIEQCNVCGELYDSYSTGHHSELTGKHYCSESCEPYGLYEKEKRAAKRKDAPFQKWLKQLKKEQMHYPALKGKEIYEYHLRKYFNDGVVPVDAPNDVLTHI